MTTGKVLADIALGFKARIIECELNLENFPRDSNSYQQLLGRIGGLKTALADIEEWNRV